MDLEFTIKLAKYDNLKKKCKKVQNENCKLKDEIDTLYFVTFITFVSFGLILIQCAGIFEHWGFGVNHPKR